MTVGRAAPMMTVPSTAKRAPEMSVVRKAETRGHALEPPMLALTSSAMVTAATTSVRKFRPGMEVVSWMTQAESTA